MQRCSICKMLTHKLQNFNGFFAMHCYPPFLKSTKDKEFLFNSRQQQEAFTNIDIRCFKIQTSDIGPPPLPWQGLYFGPTNELNTNLNQRQPKQKCKVSLSNIYHWYYFILG